MRADDVAFEAKKDLLIVHYGESYLKKHRNERSAYTCSNAMREFSRLLINYRKITKNENCELKDLLKPKCFDNVVFAVRHLSGYNSEEKTFTAPSLALHFGTNIKHLCDELINLILREIHGFTCKSTEEKNSWLEDVKNFKKMVDTRWHIEMSSLANKDLQEKK